MQTELRWIVSQSAACFHVADLLRRGRSCMDATLAGALAEPAELLRKELTAAGLPVDLCYVHLVPLAARFEHNRELAEVVLRKALGGNPRIQGLVGPLAGRIADVEAAARRVVPDLVDQLAAAAGPLQEAWGAHGQVLLAEIGGRTDERLVVEGAEVLVVPPTSEGGGIAHLPYNSLSIEAVASDPWPELPEVVRLAWLVSQLNLDLPVFSETIPPARRPRIAAVAMLPAALLAAEAMELAPCEADVVSLAARSWCGTSPEEAEVLQQWWATYLESRPPWDVALTALDRMLPESVEASG